LATVEIAWIIRFPDPAWRSWTPLYAQAYGNLIVPGLCWSWGWGKAAKGCEQESRPHTKGLGLAAAIMHSRAKRELIKVG